MIASAVYPYRGSVVLVTGAGTGIGRSIARGFLEQGACVVAVGRTESALREAIGDADAERAYVRVADVATPGASAAVVDDTIERFGRLDVVVACAGSSEPSRVGENNGAWERLRRVNLDAMVELVDACVAHLRASRGNFLAVSSIAGMRGDWGMYAYNATKAAVNVMVQSLALDLGVDGVRVNAVAPGFTDSRLTRERLDDPEFLQRLMDRTPLRRVADPDDIARAVLFICSPDAGYITGAVIPVDGGVSASSGTPRG